MNGTKIRMTFYFFLEILSQGLHSIRSIKNRQGSESDSLPDELLVYFNRVACTCAHLK